MLLIGVMVHVQQPDIVSVLYLIAVACVAWTDRVSNKFLRANSEQLNNIFIMFFGFLSVLFILVEYCFYKDLRLPPYPFGSMPEVILVSPYDFSGYSLRLGILGLVRSKGREVDPAGLGYSFYRHSYATSSLRSLIFQVDFVILWTTARCMLVNYERTFKTDYYLELIDCNYTVEDILAESAPKYVFVSWIECC